MMLVNWSPVWRKMISIVIACMNFHSFKSKLSYKTIKDCNKPFFLFFLLLLQHKILFRTKFELLPMALWWFVTSSFSGTSSGPGWNLSFLVWVWKNWPNNESGMFFGITLLFSCLWLCLWGAFTGATLRPVNGSISSHCWGLKFQKALWGRGKPKLFNINNIWSVCDYYVTYLAERRFLP